MKVLLFIPLLFSLAICGFDITAVDMTKEGQELEALPYKIAKDGKKIYKDIGKSIKALENQTIESLDNQTIQSLDNQTIQSLDNQMIQAMNVVVYHPIDSNISKSITTKSIATKKVIKKVRDDMNDAFSSINQTSKNEEILQNTKKILLQEEATKNKPINLEK